MLSGSEYQKRYNKQKTFFGKRKKTYKQNAVTNSLTKQIKDYVWLTGGAIWRVNVSPIIKTNYMKINGTTLEVVSGRIPAPNKGMSDLIAIKNGCFVGIEVKSPEDDLSDYQKLFKDNVLRSGGVHLKVRTFDEFKTAWDNITSERKSA